MVGMLLEAGADVSLETADEMNALEAAIMSEQDEIAKIEDISVSEEELDKTLSLLAQQSNMPVEQVKKHYTDNDQLGYVRNQLRENKIIEFLLSKVDIEQSR